MSATSLAALLAQLRDGAWLELDDRAVTTLLETGLELQFDSDGRCRWRNPVELLDAGRIRTCLSDAVDARVLSLDVHLVTASTNSALRRRAAPRPGKTRICLAEYQSAGRGRRGRQWVAPLASSLCLSLAWSFDTAPRMVSAMSLAVGVAVVRALRRLDLLEVGLKWPNDLVVGGSKLGGILIDAWHGSDGRASLVAGIGLNLHVTEAQAKAVAATPGLPPAALADIDPVGAARRNGLAALLIDEIVDMLDACARDATVWREDWQRFDTLAGMSVEVTTGDQSFVGRAMGVDEVGALQVEAGGQTRQFIAGDVTVRPS